MRQFRKVDFFLIEVQHGLDTMLHQFLGRHISPGKSRINPELTPTEIKVSQGCMRVNHTGEVCAQALYRGQALATGNAELKSHLHQAATEEVDHLLWCHERLNELNTKVSYLNPIWYTFSFLLGYLSAKKNDSLSLGFVEETEKQVLEHLQNHQQFLSPQDHKSRAIISVMQEDEARHAKNAHALGAVELSSLMKSIMKVQARVMIQLAYVI
ncbi:MAG: 2-polyprenyl-3-methyl-6-methoxy-1,4-benzoquinone monooxygenase [Gammaproteobacteria bacterium]|nr:2-polyprenyl-3-methyl-6-methoxy-1,4-benzoquinone monooxygenase [Gammaproteobacteria bacterium]